MNELMPSIEGVQIEIGGQIFAEFEVPSSEALGLAFAIIVLILAFGSVLAMGLPVGVALAGIGVGTILAGLLSNVLSIPDFATTVAVMLGLGVGIDYALFIVTRYRENLHARRLHRGRHRHRPRHRRTGGRLRRHRPSSSRCWACC